MAIAKHLDKEDLCNLIKGIVTGNRGIERLKETESDQELWDFYWKIKQELNNGTSTNQDNQNSPSPPHQDGDNRE